MTEKDIINMINRDKGNNPNLFGKQLNNVHNKIMDKMMGNRNNNQQNQQPKQQPMSQQELVDLVSKADYMLRDAVNTLANILIEINDKELAQRILGEHILMMSELFKSFDNQSQGQKK